MTEKTKGTILRFLFCIGMQILSWYQQCYVESECPEF